MGLVLKAAVSSEEMLSVWGEGKLQNDVFLFILKVEKHF